MVADLLCGLFLIIGSCMICSFWTKHMVTGKLEQERLVAVAVNTMLCLFTQDNRVSAVSLHSHVHVKQIF